MEWTEVIISVVSSAAPIALMYMKLQVSRKKDAAVTESSRKVLIKKVESIETRLETLEDLNHSSRDSLRLKNEIEAIYNSVHSLYNANAQIKRTTRYALDKLTKSLQAVMLEDFNQDKTQLAERIRISFEEALHISRHNLSEKYITDVKVIIKENLSTFLIDYGMLKKEKNGTRRNAYIKSCLHFVQNTLNQSLSIL